MTTLPIQNFPLWEKMKVRRLPVSFTFEITARCNNNCRHCYINLPAEKPSQTPDIGIKEARRIIDQARDMGTIMCLISGGEPLIHPDFFDIYMYLKKSGFLISLFTNAGLISKAHATLLKRYPPRNLEVSVYGVTRKTYETVTRQPGSFDAFERGLERLFSGGIKIRLKAMALRSNLHELSQIERFCRKYTKDSYRFDPFLQLRYDRDGARNREIISERLTPNEITALEGRDEGRFSLMQQHCEDLIWPEAPSHGCRHLFHCGAGKNSFTVGYDGRFRLCPSLWHPSCSYDLKKGNLRDAWEHFVPAVRGMRSTHPEFIENCRECPIINLCLWCPALAYLETGRLDAKVEYFCKVAHARKDCLKNCQQG